MRLSDEEWLARVRGRVAAGEDWESGPEEVTAEPLPAAAPPAIALRCPYCPARSALDVYRRWEAITAEPLLFCRACYGFWAKGGALAAGLVASGEPDEPRSALFAAPAPPRCRACGGRLRDDETCRKCGKSLPRLNCPSCNAVMERSKQHGVTVDICGRCHGTWFDVGELAATYSLQPPQTIMASMIDETDAPTDGELAGSALRILLGLFLRFL